jgi:thymidine kinase
MENKCGTIKLILGCMFSGKTTELQREYHEWSSINKKPLCINYSEDNRYGDNYNSMYNHNEFGVECIKVQKLEEVNIDLINNVEIILINEGQFFSDLIEYCQLWCEKYGKHIIVCGLDGDFQRKPFGKILDLIPLADSFEKLTAYCKKCSDGTKAVFTHRKTTESEQVVIGASNYEALCRKCYLRETNN